MLNLFIKAKLNEGIWSFIHLQIDHEAEASPAEPVHT